MLLAKMLASFRLVFFIFQPLFSIRTFRTSGFDIDPGREYEEIAEALGANLNDEEIQASIHAENLLWGPLHDTSISSIQPVSIIYTTNLLYLLI